MTQIAISSPTKNGRRGPTPTDGIRHSKFKRACVLAAAATALAVGVTLSPVGSTEASAYNAGDCASPASRVHSVDEIWFNGGAIDFGAGWHGNSRPPENAIVCWDRGQKFAQLRGTMYMDESANFKGSVRIAIRFLNSAGDKIDSGSQTWNFSDAGGDDWLTSSHDFDIKVTAAASEKISKVAVYGYTKSAADGSPWVLVRERTVSY